MIKLRYFLTFLMMCLNFNVSYSSSLDTIHNSKYFSSGNNNGSFHDPLGVWDGYNEDDWSLASSNSLYVKSDFEILQDDIIKLMYEEESKRRQLDKFVKQFFACIAQASDEFEFIDNEDLSCKSNERIINPFQKLQMQEDKNRSNLSNASMYFLYHSQDAIEFLDKINNIRYTNADKNVDQSKDMKPAQAVTKITLQHHAQHRRERED